MSASIRFHLKTLLSPLTVALVLAVPSPFAFAKKDLFANDPGAKQHYQSEQLAPNPVSSSSSSKESGRDEALAEHLKSERKSETTVTQTNSAQNSSTQIYSTQTKPIEVESEKKSSFFETQFSRFKGHLVEAKEDLFGNKKSPKKEALIVPQQTEATVTDSTHSTYDAHSSEKAQPEVPTISAAEAAQRAQTMAEGQVINVRKYQEEDKPRYAVKLLQKNGRMKTINLDAVNGTLIEDAPQ